jgi:hypothetical protein
MMLRMRGWTSRIVSPPFPQFHPPSPSSSLSPSPPLLPPFPFSYPNIPSTTVPDQMVSTTSFPKLQKPDTAMRVTNPTTGESGYRVGIEVFHQLHCLNLLRMSTYPEYYTKLWWSDTNDEPGKVRAHLGKSVPSIIFTRTELCSRIWSGIGNDDGRNNTDKCP